MSKNKYILVLDLETSGLPKRRGFNKYYSPKKIEYYNDSRIIELAYIIYYIDYLDTNNSKNIKKYNSLIIPCGFSINNTQFHGLNDSICKTYGKNMIDVLNNLLLDISKYNISSIISHNINFDINILLSECYRNNDIKLYNKIKKHTMECTMEMGQYYMRSFKSPKLTELYKFLFNKKLEQKHRALNDAENCLECYLKFQLM